MRRLQRRWTHPCHQSALSHTRSDSRSARALLTTAAVQLLMLAAAVMHEPAARRRELRLFEALEHKFKIGVVDYSEDAAMRRWQGRGVYIFILDRRDT
jgi:hypothetical protein